MGAYLCLAWASKDADKAFELTEELCAKVMLSVGIDNCIVEDISLKPTSHQPKRTPTRGRHGILSVKRYNLSTYKNKRSRRRIWHYG